MSAISIEITGLSALEARLSGLAKGIQGQELLLGLAREGMEQTQRRLEIEKTGPDGTPWAKTRDGRGALFIDGKRIAGNIQTHVEGSQASWGISRSAFAGAMLHQFGGVIVPVKGQALKFKSGGKEVFAKKITIPARPYLGISAQNAIALEAAATAYIASELAKGQP